MKEPSCGTKYLPASSNTPRMSAAINGPRIVPAPPTATTSRKYTMYFSGNVGSSPGTSIPSAPPSPASAEPSAKVTLNTRSTLMPRPTDACWLSTDARALDQERQRQRREHDHGDEEQPVRAQIQAEDVHLPGQERGQAHRLLRRPEGVGRGSDRHEREPDGEQH